MLRVCLGNGRDGVASHEVKKGVERFEAKDWKSGLDTLGLRTVTSQCSAEQLLDGPSGTPAWPWPRLLPEQGLRATPSVRPPVNHRTGAGRAAGGLGRAWAALTWSDPALPSGFAGIPDPGRWPRASAGGFEEPPLERWRVRPLPPGSSQVRRAGAGSCFCRKVLLHLRWLKPPPRAVVKPSLAFLLFPKAFPRGPRLCLG